MTKHTPGPWHLDGGKGQKGQLYVWSDRNEKGKGYIGTHEKCLAEVKAVYTDESGAAFWEEETRANARLIALAPRMLDVCRCLAKGECTCKDGGPDFCCDVCEAKGIVAQAEGR